MGTCRNVGNGLFQVVHWVLAHTTFLCTLSHGYLTYTRECVYMYIVLAVSLTLSVTFTHTHTHTHTHTLSRRSCSPVLRPSSLCFGQKRKREQGTSQFPQTFKCTTVHSMIHAHLCVHASRLCVHFITDI